MPTISEEPQSSSAASGLPRGGSGASHLPAQGKNANNMEQCLNMLGSYLERKKRFDNRGYRSAIRRQLRRLLEDNDIQYPDWLDDNTQPVNEWRDMQSIQRDTVCQKNWQNDHSTRYWADRSWSCPCKQWWCQWLACRRAVNVQQQMAGLQHQLGQALASLQTPPETRRDTPRAADRQEEPTSPSTPSENEVVDSRQTKSEPPMSPRPMVEEQNAGANGLPEEGIAGGQSQQTAGMTGGSLCAEEIAGVQPEHTAGMTGGSLPAEEMAGVQSQQTAGMSSGASSLPAEGSFVLADPMLASVSSAGTAGWHSVQEPFQDLSTVATQSVANLSEIDRGDL